GACGDNSPDCTTVNVGPSAMPPTPFPFPTDQPPPDNVTANGVTKDKDGYIILDQSHASFDFLWVADDTNYGMGLISKIQTTARTTVPAGAVNGKYVEVARYATITCMSDPVNGKNEGAVLGATPPANLCADGV